MRGVSEDTGRVELGLTGGRLERRIEDFGAEDHGTGGYSAYQQTGDHSVNSYRDSGSGAAGVLNSRLEPETAFGLGQVDDCPGRIGEGRGVLREELEGVAFDIEGKSIHRGPMDL